MRWRAMFRDLILSVLPVLLKRLTDELEGIGNRQPAPTLGELDRRASASTSTTTKAQPSILDVDKAIDSGASTTKGVSRR